MNNWVPKFTPHLDLRDPQIIESIIEIEAYKRSIIKIPLPPGFKKRLNQLNIVRAIKGTTGIEGNTLSEENIGKLVENSKPNPINLEEVEVVNAGKVLEFIKNKGLSHQPCLLTEEIIKEIHYILTNDCGYKDNIPGRYRDHQAKAGDFYPPRASEIPDLMKQFVSFINSREIVEGHTAIIRAILAHFYLVSIHPFGDGNGRTSRAIEALILFSAGYNIIGFYSLANFYYKNRSRYIDELQAARFVHHESLMSFVLFSLQGYKSELDLIQDEILSFIKERFFKDYVDELLRKDEINDRIFNLLFHLVNNKTTMPEITFKGRTEPIMKALYSNVTERTFYRDLEIMDKLNLIVINNGYVQANIETLNKFLSE